MKKYLLFSGDYYYASGGTGDFIASFETIDEAKTAFSDIENTDGYQWAEIALFDGENLTTVSTWEEKRRAAVKVEGSHWQDE